jgi:endoglucanase
MQARDAGHPDIEQKPKGEDMPNFKLNTLCRAGGVIGLALSLSLLAMAGQAWAQAGVNTSGTDPEDHMTYDREADLVKDKIKSNNAFENAGKTTAYVRAGEAYAPMAATDEVRQMGAGINVIPGWDGFWNGGSTKFKLAQIDKIKEAGFSTIRIPLQTFGKNALHMDAQGHLDPAYLRKLDTIVDAALAKGLFVIIDEHDFDDCSKDTNACSQILPNVWYELSEHYKDAPAAVMFELLNEPHDKIDAQIWNAWLPDLVAIVRETNPTRNIIVGPTHWNSLADLPLLKLPNDQHIIVTFHYYEPMTFTHQGATWVGPEIEKERGEVHWKGTDAEMAKINGDFDQVAAWAKANNHPILLGEFGTYAKFSAIDERAAWTRAVSKAAADRGFARAAWEFNEGPDGFTVYDIDKNQWVEPIKNAVLLK